MSERLICVIRLGFEPKTHSLEGNKTDAEGLF